MVGHKLGEFSPTRTYRGHTGHTAEDKAMTAQRAKVRPPRQNRPRKRSRGGIDG